MCDSALLCHLLHADRTRLAEDDSLLGVVTECFAGMELVKQISSSRTRASLAHMRSATGAEIDFVLSAPDGHVAAVEVKASATVRGEDFKHLAKLRDSTPKGRFVRGVVLYTGRERLPFGERLEAWPLSTLWSH